MKLSHNRHFPLNPFHTSNFTDMPDIEPSKRHGILFAVAAFSVWGFFPLYFKLMAHLSPVEVVAWRCVWSFTTLGVVISLLQRWDHFLACFRSWRKFLHLTLSMIMITSNWGLFVYAVTSSQVLQSSLAYFINPLVSVLLGVVFLHERLRRTQVISISLATVGVLIMTFAAGGFPSLAILLAFSFGAYGYLHKVMRGVDGLTGLSVETGLATLPGLLVIFCFRQNGLGITDSSTIALTTFDYLLLASMGTLTTAPLLLFIGAARRLPLSTVGMLQYITPTLHFSLAVFAFGEPFSVRQLISFGFIWVAVALFLIDSRRTRLTPPI